MGFKTNGHKMCTLVTVRYLYSFLFFSVYTFLQRVDESKL